MKKTTTPAPDGAIMTPARGLTPPPTRPDRYCWSGPLKQSNTHQLRDFLVLTAIATALAYSALALGLI